MNERKSLLDQMSLIDPSYVEQAVYPEKKKRRLGRFGMLAACLALLAALSVTALATGAADAVRSYFFGVNDQVQSLLHPGGQTTEHGNAAIRLDNYIADEAFCWFTVSFSGFDHPIRTGDRYYLVWVGADGTENQHFDKGCGAYTKPFLQGFGGEAEAKSEYTDADATLIFSCQAPRDTKVSDYTCLRLTYEDMTLEVHPADALVPMYDLRAPSDAPIRNVRVSQIGFYFEAAPECENFDVLLIDKAGTYLRADEGEFLGYSLSYGFCGEEWMPVAGSWSGGSGISLGIMDLEQYQGICINGTDCLFP